MRMRTFLLLLATAVFSHVWGYNNSIKTARSPVWAIENAGKPAATLMNINNWSSWIFDNGRSGFSPLEKSGGIYPRGTAPVIFEDGFVWGGYVRDGKQPELRVGGQTYVAGTQPGKIISPGVAQGLNDPAVRIYRIRADWQTASSMELAEDASELLDKPVWQVTQTEIDQVRMQYETDWNEWPVDMGAPFNDLNNNGIYEPGSGDTPGIADAHQVIWLVCNDLDSVLTKNLYGSSPMGIELQVTMWGYNVPGYYGQVMFRRYRMINKSGYAIDSTFVASWADPDLGKYSDDLAGCDKELNLAFAYNGEANDGQFEKFDLAPPAFGYDLLQGPVVPSKGDTAIFDLKKRVGYRNLPMTSFGYFASGGTWDDPLFKSYDGTLQWYNMLNGYLPSADLENRQPYLHNSGPQAGQPTKFPLDGDPVTGSGDVDGIGFTYPGDRRIYLTSGPFNMMPGDTQEVVVGIVGGISNTALMSVSQLKNNDLAIQEQYSKILHNAPGKVSFTAIPHYADGAATQIHFKAFSGNVDSIQIFLKDYDGHQVTAMPLFDDGAHGDGAANDGTFGNDWLASPRPDGLYGDAQVRYANGATFSWPKVYVNLTTAGPVKIARLKLDSDNMNHDGIANPGENIRFTVDVQNRSGFDLSSLQIKALEPLERQYINNLYAPNGDKILSVIPNGTTGAWAYSPDSEFYQFDIDGSFPASDSLHLILEMSDAHHNSWKDTVAVWVAPYSFQPQDSLMTRIAGDCYGLLGYRIIDPAQIGNHTYQITFPGENQHYTVEDLSTGDTLLTDQPYPDAYGQDSPVINGFMVTRGTTLAQSKIGGWQWISGGERWLTGAGRSLPLFWGGIGQGKDFFFSTLSDDQYHSVKIIFDQTLQTNCSVYRQDLNYKYNGIGTFYGAAYDISDSLNPRRLNISFIEDNNNKPADMIWNPDTSSRGGDEYFFIMNSNYDSLNAGGYGDSNPAIFADIMWSGWTKVDFGHTFLESPAELYLRMDKKVGPYDVFQIGPPITGIISQNTKPMTFKLFQNYPNPFNPETNLRFTLAHPARVKLEIYNVLGQKVKTLVDETLLAGEHKVKWDGRNDTGHFLGTGVYFFRISAGDYIKTRKMLLLK